MVPDSEPSGSTLNGLANGLRVIRAFGVETPALSLSDVARIVEISRASARRILLTLKEEGYVEQSGRLFRLSLRVLDLGYAFISSQGPDSLVYRVISELANRTTTSCNVTALEGDEIVYLYRVGALGGSAPSFSTSIGSRLPAHLSAMGRVLIAALPDDRSAAFLSRLTLTKNTRFTVTDPDEFAAVIEKVRSQGWSLVKHEHGEGLCSLAVAINVPGRTIALGLGWLITDQTPEQRIQDLIPLLEVAAEDLRRAFLTFRQ